MGTLPPSDAYVKYPSGSNKNQTKKEAQNVEQLAQLSVLLYYEMLMLCLTQLLSNLRANDRTHLSAHTTQILPAR
jgi:hypothetical protein